VIGTRSLAKVVCVVVLALSIAAWLAQAAQSDDMTAIEAGASGPLDGMVFAGLIGPEDNRELDDELHFNNGRFWSKACLECGFQPGMYWSRRVGDEIHFRGTLRSDDRGNFDYEGVVDGDDVTVTIHWTKRRWYWTIDRRLAFRGTTVADQTAATAAEASAGATRAQPELLRRCDL